MSLCNKCNEIVQAAAIKSVLRKRQQPGLDDAEKKKIVTDPFVVVWVPEMESKKPPVPKYYPPDPNCPEFDYTIDLSTGNQEICQRIYPIRPRKPEEF